MFSAVVKGAVSALALEPPLKPTSSADRSARSSRPASSFRSNASEGTSAFDPPQPQKQVGSGGVAPRPAYNFRSNASEGTPAVELPQKQVGRGGAASRTAGTSRSTASEGMQGTAPAVTQKQASSTGASRPASDFATGTSEAPPVGTDETPQTTRRHSALPGPTARGQAHLPPEPQTARRHSAAPEVAEPSKVGQAAADSAAGPATVREPVKSTNATAPVELAPVEEARGHRRATSKARRPQKGENTKGDATVEAETSAPKDQMGAKVSLGGAAKTLEVAKELARGRRKKDILDFSTFPSTMSKQSTEVPADFSMISGYSTEAPHEAPDIPDSCSEGMRDPSVRGSISAEDEGIYSFTPVDDAPPQAPPSSQPSGAELLYRFSKR